MMYRILLVLAYLLYWVAESQSESWTWLASSHSTEEIPPKAYHLFRLPETLAIMGSFFLNGYLLFGINGLIVMSISTVTGVILYERFYCLRTYHNFWHEKQSEWLGISHLKVWQEIVLFVVSVISLGYIL